ncbi:hypothetical protein AAVH_16114 [Aphelenchoides avenae]|nr:hypothetical protein AAVH_16114 [Aphelenchus avenae]
MQFLVDDISLNLTDLDIVPADPTVFVDQMQVKGLLYWSNHRTKEHKNVKFAVASITSTNPLPVTDVHLKPHSESSTARTTPQRVPPLVHLESEFILEDDLEDICYLESEPESVEFLEYVLGLRLDVRTMTKIVGLGLGRSAVRRA